ncbi:MAG: MFS transporter [Dehalococcoidia bacterium]
MSHLQAASPAEPYDRRWWALGVLVLSLVLIGLDNTIVNVALPTLVRDLNATNSELQWTVDAYTLLFAGLLLTAGSVADRYGRKGTLNFGLIVFGIGSVLCALARTPTQLIATRALVGSGGAFIMPSTLSILTNMFPPSERARAIGLWAAAAGIGIPLGPVAGGWLLEHFYWGSVFLVSVPVVVAALAFGQWLVPTSRASHQVALDIPGAALSFAGLAALVYALIEAPNRGWTSTSTLALFAASVTLLVAFMVRELRTTAPLLDMRFFRRPRFSAASGAIALIFFALFGSLFALTQYLQFVLGYSPLEAGIRVVPVAAGLLIGAPSSPRLAERVGSKLVVAAGMTLTATGLFLMSRLTVDTSYLKLVIALVVMSIGMGFSMAPATESIMGSIPRAKAGVGSAMNDTTRQVGGALGVAVIGSVISSRYGAGLDPLAGTLPPAGLATARQSLGAALEEAGRLGPSGAPLAATARDSFVHAMHAGFVVGAAVALLGAVVVLAFLPARGEDVGENFEEDEEAAAPAGMTARYVDAGTGGE